MPRQANPPKKYLKGQERRYGNPAMASNPAYSDRDLKEFVDQYLETALWVSTDEDGEPLDREYDVGQFTKKAEAQAKKDAKAFLGARVIGILPAKGEKPRQWTVAELIEEYGNGDFSLAGHDFLLTRGGHGAGFWDGDWAFKIPGSPQDLGEILSDKSEQMGSKEVYVYAYRGKLHMD